MGPGRSGLRSALGAALLSMMLGGVALADPCKAIPDRGPTPAYLAPGSLFEGPVAYVRDGGSLCVALGPGREDWVEVRVADFYAPELEEPGGREAKQALENITHGARLSCRAGKRSYDRRGSLHLGALEPWRSHAARRRR